MKENRYDDEVFFQKYAQMDRSQKGLAGAGEWPALQKILPDFTGRRVLDLGCGYGWHCKYAAETRCARRAGHRPFRKNAAHGEREKTRPRPLRTGAPPWRTSISRTARLTSCLSSLAFHYTPDFPALVRAIARWLTPNGSFVFSAEHPIFTAFGSQDWVYGPNGEILYFPVDRYFDEGAPRRRFPGGTRQKIPPHTDDLSRDAARKRLCAAARHRTAAAAGAARTARHARRAAPPDDAPHRGAEGILNKRKNAKRAAPHASVQDSPFSALRFIAKAAYFDS